MTRWNLSIPEKTDRAVRAYLARVGGKKGDLSKFVDKAVRRYVLKPPSGTSRNAIRGTTNKSFLI